jgi:hypothetical protein
LPLATLRSARQRTPRLAARVAAADRRARAQAVLPQPSGSCFQTHWYLHLPLLRRRHVMVLELFSYPGRRFLHAWDRQHLHSLHRRGTHPVNGHRPRGWTSHLFSSQPRPGLGGEPCGELPTSPGDGQTSPVYSIHSVQYLYIHKPAVIRY